MSVLKTCRPPKRCFPWKCGSQRAPEFTQLTTPRNRTPIRHPVRCCRLACQSGKTQTHIKNLTDTSWLALLSRHKHLHSEVKKKERRRREFGFSRWLFSLKRGYSVMWVKRCSSWNISAASITSVKWKHTGREIKRVLWSAGGWMCCSVSQRLCGGRST